MNKNSRFERRREILWAMVRLTLGMGQIIGATAALLLLLKTGVSEVTIALVVLTSIFTGISILLFGNKFLNVSGYFRRKSD